jgi:hypothetical protein
MGRDRVNGLSQQFHLTRTQTKDKHNSPFIFSAAVVLGGAGFKAAMALGGTGFKSAVALGGAGFKVAAAFGGAGSGAETDATGGAVGALLSANLSDSRATPEASGKGTNVLVVTSYWNPRGV